MTQFTPPGSPSSVIFGRNVTAAKPGSAQGLYLIVSDIATARNALISRGVEVSDVFHAGGKHAGTDEPYISGRARVNGPDPDHGSYGSFASFGDPDGNGWLFQEVTARLPGRVEADTTFPSSTDLASALRRAAAAHGEHEKRNGGQHDANWPDWYAAYIVNEQAGKPLPCERLRRRSHAMATISDSIVKQPLRRHRPACRELKLRRAHTEGLGEAARPSAMAHKAGDDG